MDLNTTREAKGSAATRELPNISWNSKVHYRIPNSPPLVLILSQTDPVNTIHSLSLQVKS
jgi:hypothetical protein